MIIFRILALTLLACVQTVMFAAVKNRPAFVPVKFHGHASGYYPRQVWDNFANPPQYVTEWDYASSPQAKLNGLWSTWHQFYDEASLPYATTKLEPYKVYSADVGVFFNTIEYSTVSGFLKVIAPPGYRVELNGFIRDRFAWSGGMLADSIRVRVIEEGSAYGGAVATPSEIESGRIRWQVSLGTLPDGQHAGNLTLVGHGRGDDWGIYCKASALSYEQISNDVYVYNKNSVIRQIYAPQAFVDVTETSTSLSLKFYHPDQVKGSTYPKTFDGVPFETYTIQKGDTATSLGILRETRDVQGKTDMATVSATTKTSLIRSGAAPDFTWTKSEWMKATEATAYSEEVRLWTANTGGFVETLTVKDAHDSQVVLNQTSTMKAFSWGGELPLDVTTGTVNSDVSYSTYYENANDIGSYGGIKLSQDSGGGWQYVEYAQSSDAANVGNVVGTYAPFTTGPAAPAAGTVPSKTSGVYTKYTYSADPFKMKRRLATAETKVNDILVSKVANTYENVSVNSKEAIRITRKQSTDNGTGELISTDVYYREDVSDYFYRNQVHSTTTPEGTRQSYVRQRGTLGTTHRWGNPATPSAYTFTASSSTAKPIVLGSRICAINGLAADPGGTPTATKLSTQYGYTITAVWLVHGRSTMDVTIRDYMSRVLRTETHVWNRPGSAAGAWEIVSWMDYYYDRASNLVKTIDNVGSIYDAAYTGGLKAWDQAADGTYQEYAYDNANRLWKVTTQAKGSVGARTTEYKYDATGRILESKSYAGAEPTGEIITSSTAYDNAGRVTSATKEGLEVATYSYDPPARRVTQTAPDAGTKITELYLDGQVKSTTGTSVVASHNTYGVETNGRMWASVTVGPENSGRYTKSWKDWLGREVRKETPGFTGQPVIVETQTYDPTKGLLTKKTRGVVESSSDRRTIADTLNQYDAFGLLLRSGLDVNGNGTLDLAGPDTVGGSTQSYFKDASNHWWSQTRNSAYLTTGTAVETTTGVTRTRLTGFTGNMRSETKTYGPETNFSNLSSLDEVDYKREWKEVNRTTGEVLSHVKQPYLASNARDTSYNGLLTQSEGADGITITKRYDGLWRLAGTTDPRTGESTQTYKSGTNLVETQYDGRGLESGRVATFEYDEMGRVKCQTDAKGHKTRTAYTPRGEVWRIWGDAALPNEAVYDDFGKRQSFTTYRSEGNDPTWTSETWPSAPPAGDVSTWDYDGPSGLLWKQTDAKNRVVEYSYDERGQLYQRKWARKVSTAPNSEQVTTTYDYKRKPLGAYTLEYYDGGTSPSKVTYNDGVTPEVTYGPIDRSGNPSTIQDYAGLRSFNYDSTKPWRGLNNIDLPAAFYGQRKFSRILEDATSTSAGAYGEHTLATHKGRVAGFALSAPGSAAIDLQQVARFSNKGRFAGVDLPLTTRSYRYGYKTNSALLSGYQVSDLTFTASHDYEPHRDLMTQVSSRWGVLRVLSQHDYVYDAGGRRDAVTASGESTQQEYGASLFTDFNYDGRGQLLAANVGRGGDLLRPLPGRQFGFSYDTIGNRLTSTRTTASEADTYTPNELNQIDQRTNHVLPVSGLATNLARVAVHDQLAARSGNYWHASVPNLIDPAGNAPGYVDGAISAATVESAVGGKDTAQTEQRPLIFPPAVEVLAHDEDGNLHSDGSYIYSWDAENRLIQVEPKPIVGAPAALLRKRVTFRYDYLSRRIEKTAETAAGTGTPSWQQTERRRFLYQGWNLFAEFSVATNGTLTLAKSYTWGLDLGGTLTASGGVGALVQIRHHATGEVHLPTYDAGGNVTSLVDAANGVIVAAYEYGPFGETLSIRGTAAKANPFRFSTKFFDGETGLYYYGYRYYDPRNGRFINRDPLGDKGGLNLYAFVGNSPISGFDVWGLSGDEFGDGAWESAFDFTYDFGTAFLDEGWGMLNRFGEGLGYAYDFGVDIHSAWILATLYEEDISDFTFSTAAFNENDRPTIMGGLFDAGAIVATAEAATSVITLGGYNVAKGTVAFAEGNYEGAQDQFGAVAIGYGVAAASTSLRSTSAAIRSEVAAFTRNPLAGTLDDFKFDVGSGNPAVTASYNQAYNATAQTGNAGARLTQSVGDLRAAGLKDAHHVIQDAAVRDLFGYGTRAAPGVQLAGPSTAVGTPHYIATQVQRQAGGGTYAAERAIGYKALRNAGYTEAQARQIITETDQYFQGLGVTPNTPTRIPGNRK